MSSIKPPSWVAFDFLGVFLPRGVSAGLNYVGIKTQLSARLPVLSLLEGLKEQDIHLALASNSRRRWIVPWLEEAGVVEDFTVILTPDDGVLKPDHEYFQKLVEKCGVPASQVLFLDDGRRNVEAAKECGLRAGRCWDYPSIVGVLRAEGIKIPD